MSATGTPSASSGFGAACRIVPKGTAAASIPSTLWRWSLNFAPTHSHMDAFARSCIREHFRTGELSSPPETVDKNWAIYFPDQRKSDGTFVWMKPYCGGEQLFQPDGGTLPLPLVSLSRHRSSDKARNHFSRLRRQNKRFTR